MSQIIYMFLLVITTSFAISEVSVVPDKIITFEGSVYTLHLQASADVEVHKCTAEYSNGAKYNIDVNKPGQKAEVLESPQNASVIEATSLGNGICGFRVTNASYTGEMSRWTLNITDNNQNVYSKTVKVTIYDKERLNPPLETVEVEKGGKLSVYCSAEMELTYCELYQPDGRMVKWDEKSCYHVVEQPSAQHTGTWRCHRAYKYLLEPQVAEFQVVFVDRDVVHTWQTESDTQVEIGCNVTHSKGLDIYCSVVRPDGQKLKLQPGLASDRYTTLGTDIRQSRCALQIQKPLKDNEYGMWSCELRKKYKYDVLSIGGFIAINKGTADVLPSPIIPKVISSSVNGSLSMECRVFYSSPYCYFRSPNGTLYPVENSITTTVGYCALTKADVQLSDNGTWTCGFAKDTGTSDDTFNFQVMVAQAKSIQPQAQEVTSRLGASVTMICTTRGLGDHPLQYCRFLSPTGKMYHVTSNATAQRLNYDGRGLEFGDCGIRLSKVEVSDAGIWSCVTRIGADFTYPEVYDNILLVIDKSEDLTTASAFGIAIGVIVILSGVAFFAVRRYRSRASSRNPDADTSVHFARNEDLLPAHDGAVVNFNSCNN